MDDELKFTAATHIDIANWETDFARLTPSVSVDAAFEETISIASFVSNGVANGMLLKVCTPIGTEHFIHLNPVVAHHLMMAVAKAGQYAGWLDENLRVTARTP